MFGGTGTAMNQVRNLRKQMETAEPAVAPSVVATIARVAATVQHAAGRVNTNYKMVILTVRARPIIAVFVATSVGFILGRAVR